MPFKSILGKLLGYDTTTNQLMVNGSPLGGANLVGRGNTFYVDSAVNAGSGRSPAEAVGTIDAAVNLCTASQGDTIVVLPGHSETIVAAAGIACDVAGVTVVGLGTGNQRPAVNLGTLTTATVAVSAAGVAWYNMRLLSTVADLVTAFNVTAAGFSMIGCELGDSAVDLNMLSAVKATSTTDGNANDITLIGNYFRSQDAATLGFFIHAGDVLKATIEDNIIVSEGTGLATIFTSATGKDIRMLSCRRNRLSSKATAGNLAWSNDTASPNNSGIISDNYIGHADVTGGHVLGVVGGCRMFNNLSVSTDALSGFVIPAIDVDL